MSLADPQTIAAPATGEGGAIALIRVSGENAFAACDRIFRHPGGKKIADQPGHTLLFGDIVTEQGKAVDEVLVSVFRAPRSYTGEDMVEIGCHGSPYIKSEILGLLFRQGVRPAGAGEFTLRAFIHGKMDLSQAEAVADLISAEDRAGHELAMNQLRGGYSSEFAALRDRLSELAALLELELDFGEEDVEFADRSRLQEMIGQVLARTEGLRESFGLGNVLKNGVPVAIAGAPNVGKSTLLNALLKEERAMVSDIAGTTRDYIEESLVIGGIRFRFIDTAGLRETDDRLEAMGIERSHRQMEAASLVLLVVSADDSPEETLDRVAGMPGGSRPNVVIVMNKSDRITEGEIVARTEALRDRTGYPVFPVSAKNGAGLDSLTGYIAGLYDTGGENPTIVTNARHYRELGMARESLLRAASGIETGLSTDLLAQEVREAIRHLSAVTGEITPDEVLGTIFSKFCIGK